jgi:tetratricopeptide (TPR) repeat protein
MVKIILFLLTFVPCATFAQVNRFEHAAPARYVSQYVPMTLEEMIIRSAYEKMMAEKFEEYFDKAYEQLNKGNLYNFLNYAHYALNTGYSNSTLYYHMGISYCLIGNYKYGKKFLKKAKKRGLPQAYRALAGIKMKRTVTNDWLYYD